MLLFAIIGIKAVPQAWDIWIRIPAMLIGVLLGKYVKDGKTINGLVFGIITGCIAVFSTYIQLNFATQYSLMLFLPVNALFTIFIFSFIFKFNKKCLPFMNKIIGFFGAFTFEIYITHERTQQYLYRILNSMFNLQISYSNNWYQLSVIIIAIIISIGLSKLIGLIIKKIENKKKLKKDITQKP